MPRDPHLMPQWPVPHSDLAAPARSPATCTWPRKSPLHPPSDYQRPQTSHPVCCLGLIDRKSSTVERCVTAAVCPHNGEPVVSQSPATEEGRMQGRGPRAAQAAPGVGAPKPKTVGVWQAQPRARGYDRVQPLGMKGSRPAGSFGVRLMCQGVICQSNRWRLSGWTPGSCTEGGEARRRMTDEGPLDSVAYQDKDRVHARAAQRSG
jgi:hypothetical protein